MNAAELRAHRLNTVAFIMANPIELVLVPRAEDKTGTGSKMSDLPAREPQTVRLIDQSSTSGPTPGLTQAGDGSQRKAQHQLLLRHDGVVGPHDYWIDADGVRWEVEDLLPDNGYERRARVKRYA